MNNLKTLNLLGLSLISVFQGCNAKTDSTDIKNLNDNQTTRISKSIEGDKTESINTKITVLEVHGINSYNLNGDYIESNNDFIYSVHGSILYLRSPKSQIVDMPNINIHNESLIINGVEYTKKKNRTPNEAFEPNEAIKTYQRLNLPLLDLSKISLSSTSSITGEIKDKKTRFNIELSGQSKAYINNLKVGYLKIELSGQSTSTLTSLRASDIDTDLSGQSSLEFIDSSTFTLNADISGMSSIKGDVKYESKHISTSGMSSSSI